MKKIFKIKYHSFIDVITNSSSELFVSTDKNVLKFFQELVKESEIKSGSSYLQLKTVKEAKEVFGLEEKLKDLDDNDMVLLCEIDSESYDFIYEIMGAFKFESINW